MAPGMVSVSLIFNKYKPRRNDRVEYEWSHFVTIHLQSYENNIRVTFSCRVNAPFF
jgi:hypothetical protein